MSAYKCENHKLDLCCIGCVKAWIARHDRMLEFLKNEISLRKYICTTNHAVLLDNAEKLLKEIGKYDGQSFDTENNAKNKPNDKR